MRRQENVILVDYCNESDWDFLKAVNDTTKREWKVMRCISSFDRSGFFSNLKRYIKYFLFSFKIFMKRKSFPNIIAWQQFYGLLFAFYCRIFHVKKKCSLLVMTFIYKPKPGFIGRLYYKLMNYVVNSRYIDKIICFSSYECFHYKKVFGVKEDKFIFVPLGEHLQEPDLSENPDAEGDRDYILSIGLSNRDFDFLIDVLKDTKYQVKIFGNKNSNEFGNIKMTSAHLSEDACYKAITHCRCMAIPLKDLNIAAGNLAILHAMQVGRPVIVSNSKGIQDLITQGENGFIAFNDKKTWLHYIDQIYHNEELYHTMCRNAKIRYANNHTFTAMGKAVGNVFTTV